MRRGRRFLGAIFIVCMMLLGLVAGTFVGGRFFVPPGSGLAGPGIALGYGVVGAVGAGILAAILTYVLPPRWFLGAALPVTLAGVLIAIYGADAYLDAEADRRAALDEAYARLNAFSAILVHVGDADAPFARMEIDGSRRRYEAVLRGAPPRTCAAPLSGPEAVALLGALREVEGVLLADPFPCAGTLGEVERELDWRIAEAKPPHSGGKHAITAACARQHPALMKPFEAAAKIIADGDHARECR